MDNLKKITVLSLEQATVVPYLTYRLAMDGIKVIRLEHPTYGDPNRMVGEKILKENLMNSYYICINAGKKSVTIDLSTEKGKKILQKIINKLNIDIFITNQLPKNYKKLGIEYEELKSIKKDLIWIGISGFGPNSNKSAYDPILQASSGLMELTGEADRSPQVLGIPLPDMGTSEHAYGLIMKALYKREISNKGSEINLSMYESSISWLTVPIAMTINFNKVITRRGNTHDFFCPVSVFESLDGYIYIAIGNNKQWNNFISNNIFKSLNKKEYEKNQGRIKNSKKINESVNEITKKKSSAELISILQESNIPSSNIKTIQQVIEDPLTFNKLIYTTDRITNKTIKLAPPPYSTEFLKKSKNTLSFPPRLGENNHEILKKIGLSKNEIEKLKNKKII